MRHLIHVRTGLLWDIRKIERNIHNSVRRRRTAGGRAAQWVAGEARLAVVSVAEAPQAPGR